MRLLGAGYRRVLLAAAVVGSVALAAPIAAEAAPALLPSGPPIGSLDSVVIGPQALTISGWALDPDVSAPITVHIYLDGQGVSVLSASDERPDIGAAFPDYGAAHGFHVIRGVAPGTHSVCAYAIDQAGSPLVNSLLGCKTVTVLGGLPIGRVESIQILPGAVVVRGWALDPLENDPMTVQLSGEVFSASDPEWDNTTAADLPRADIGAAFPGYGAAHGFVVVSRIPVWGAREFSVYALATQNGSYVRQAPIYGFGAPNSGNWPDRFQIPLPNPFGSLDSVTQTGVQQVSLSGWAFDVDATATQLVHVYVDGQFATQLNATSARDDIGAALPFGSDHGYSTTLTMSTPGPHSVCAYGINQNVGGNTLLGCRTVLVRAGSPIGSLDTVSSSGPGALSLSGWALDPDVTNSPTAVRVYVDGAFGLGATASDPRADVDAAYPLFGNAHGWSARLTGLAAGPHQVCAYAIDQGSPAAGNTTLGCVTAVVG